MTTPMAAIPNPTRRILNSVADRPDDRTIATTGRRRSSVLIGLTLGALAVGLGAVTAIGGPLAGLAVLIGLGTALYVLTDLLGGLYVTLAVVALLPFGALPVKIAITPSLIDLTLGTFIVVYLAQWMIGLRSRPRFTLAHLLAAAFVGFMIFSFVAGLGHAVLSTNILRKFAELVLNILAALILMDVIRDVRTLRRLIFLVLAFAALESVIGVVLDLINADTAERLLDTLGRFGYPVGGVIRYVEENPALAERAIGTWIDPNAFGGFLVIVGILGVSQILAVRPVAGRLGALILTAPIVLALLLTNSRGGWAGFAAGCLVLAAVRKRWLIPVAIVAAVAFLVLPFTQAYAGRLLAGLTNQDLATQMRFGEYKDALTLIQRYPLIGVGFAGVPDRDIYLGVSSLYLTIAENTGVIGLILFVAALIETFRYGIVRWRGLIRDALIFDVWLGLSAALGGALISGIFDHFYFDTEFTGAALLFWLTAGLALTAARLGTPEHETPSPSIAFQPPSKPINTPVSQLSKAG